MTWGGKTVITILTNNANVMVSPSNDECYNDDVMVSPSNHECYDNDVMVSGVEP